jgi:hypothetical protein
MIGIPKYRNIIVDGLSRISTNGNANIGVDSINKVNNKNSFIMMIGGLAWPRLDNRDSTNMSHFITDHVCFS